MDDLLDRAPCGFLSFTDDGIVAEVNATLLELLGYSRAELTGAHVEVILTTAGRIFYQTHLFPLVKMHGRAEEVYILLRRRDGSDVPVLANALRRERGGRPMNDCVFVTMRQRHKYEDELLHAKRSAEEATQIKARFLSMMSHELRTPLNAISGFADLLSMGIRGPVNEAQTEDLRRIKGASVYLLALINDMLNFSRLESGRVPYRLQPVPVCAAIALAEELVTNRAAEAGIEYVRAPCAPDLSVRADPERLQQILLNLLTNAVKYTPPGGRISVSCDGGDGRTRIHVTDTGRGIAADRLGHIFDPFVQVERERNEASQQGVGLGLAISRDLARAMGGDITVRSTPGVGSTFTLSLPAA